MSSRRRRRAVRCALPLRRSFSRRLHASAHHGALISPQVRFAFKKVVLEAPMTYRSLSSASPKGLLGGAAAPTGLQRQTSVDIDPTDAAIQKRQVEMHARSWLAPPSPAPGKDVAKRVCDTLLLGGWDAAALER